MLTATTARPIEHTHVATGCTGRIQAVDGTHDGVCGSCLELLPGVFAPGLPPNVLTMRRDVAPHERGFVNAYAHYLTRLQRRSFRGISRG